MPLWGGAWGGPATPTGYASVLIPLFKYYSERITISSTNNTLVFRETVGADLTATIASGTFYWGELAYKIKVALEAAGASTYTVTYNHSTRKFTIASDGTGGGGVFQIRGGIAGTNDAWDDIGYNATVTGALTYTADTAVPAQTTLTLTTKIRQPQPDVEANREDTVLDTGRKESAFFGMLERYSFRLEFESVASMQGLYDMFVNCAAFGNSVDFYPDSTTSDYVTVFWDTRTFRPREMTDRNLYRLWEIDMVLLVKVPVGSGAITERGLIDRRPTS